MLANRYKLAILVVVGIAVVSIFIFSAVPQFAPAVEETAEPEETVDAVPEQVLSAEFKPAEDPFFEYTNARNNNKPIVLEFYARW